VEKSATPSGETAEVRRPRARPATPATPLA
jgi:hypothetical protein